MIELAENYKFDQYITLEEFSSIFPEISYFVKYEYTESQLKEFKETLMKRFGLEEDQIESWR